MSEEPEKFSGQLQTAKQDPSEVAQRVLANLKQLPRQLDDLTPVMKRHLVMGFVERVEVDMGTKDAEVFLKLPSWALNEGRLENSSPSSTVDETNPLVGIRLALADCKYHYVRGSKTRQVCYKCRRRQAA